MYNECEAVEMAVNYLADLGHRRMALVEYSSWQRLHAVDAFFSALARRNLPADAERQLVPFEPRQWHQFKALFGTDGVNPTAIVTLYAIVAARAVSFLRSMNLSVPEDVSVVNINGPLEGTADEIDLTTAVPPNKKIIDHAISLLTRGFHKGEVRRIQFSPDFHAGRTAAPCRDKRIARRARRAKNGSRLERR